MKIHTLATGTMILFLSACTPQPEPRKPGSQCTTKLLSYEEMAATHTNRHFKTAD